MAGNVSFSEPTGRMIWSSTDLPLLWTVSSFAFTSGKGTPSLLSRLFCISRNSSIPRLSSGGADFCCRRNSAYRGWTGGCLVSLRVMVIGKENAWETGNSYSFLLSSSPSWHTPCRISLTLLCRMPAVGSAQTRVTTRRCGFFSQSAEIYPTFPELSTAPIEFARRTNKHFCQSCFQGALHLPQILHGVIAVWPRITSPEGVKPGMVKKSWRIPRKRVVKTSTPAVAAWQHTPRLYLWVYQPLLWYSMPEADHVSRQPRLEEAIPWSLNTPAHQRYSVSDSKQKLNATSQRYRDCDKIWRIQVPNNIYVLSKL